MQTPIKQTLKKSWDRMASSNLANLPLLSAGEQTKGSWAREIESYDQVPEVYTDFFNNLHQGINSFPYTVITPTYRGFLRRETEKLVCSLDHKICVLEEDNYQLLSSCYALEDIDFIETGTVLLKSWLRIHGLVVDGKPSSSTLIFNSVTEYMFDPIIQKVRPTITNAADKGLSTELSKFDSLAEVNFKLMNYAKKSIVPGGQVIKFVLQPEIRVGSSELFGLAFSRTISNAHITILTDKELIMIQDTGGRKWSQDIRYGGTWYYVPINQISSVSLLEKDSDLLTLSINLSAGEHIENIFSASNGPEVKQLLHQLEKQMPGS